MTGDDDPRVADAFCRVCWRPQRGAVQRLACGCIQCADCVAALAAVAFQAPTRMLPLRCACGQPIPAAALSRVLAPHQVVYYAFLTQQQAAAKRALVAAGEPLMARCDFCAAPTRLATPHDAQQLLQDCGHVYCNVCVLTLQTAVVGDAICCKEFEWTRRLDMSGTSPRLAAPATVDDAAVPVTPAAAPSVRTPTPTRPPSAKGKGKRKLQAADADVVDLLDSDDAASDDAIVGADALDDPEVCRLCGAPVDAATNRFRAGCGHVFCRACLHARSLRALQNEEQGSIGIPVRCCGALVALDVLRALLSRRNFAKYEALVARRGDVAAPRTSKRKAAATMAAATAKRARRDDADEEAAACVACMADVAASDDRLTGPCGHVYCLTCLATMARQSVEDRALVPIRCCQQEFPVEYVKRVLSKAQWSQYERFLQEKDWRQSNLKSDLEYAAMVRAINGKQCPTCGVGVQKIAGCDAMRCLRGHLFCFACETAPCMCGRTRLENYGWVPSGTAPAAAPAGATIAQAMLQAMERARAMVQQTARAKPKARRR